MIRLNSHSLLKYYENLTIHWGINPQPSKTQPFSFFGKPLPLLNLQTVQAPPSFKATPPPWFFVTNPLKIRFFSEPP